jgi:hypothetical protein
MENFKGLVKILRYKTLSHEYNAEIDGRNISVDPFVSNCIDHEKIDLKGVYHMTGYWYDETKSLLIAEKIKNVPQPAETK